MNFILGIGVDIQSIRLFRNKSKEHKALQKVFTSAELAYCFSQHNPAQHLAVRYAAKEAIIKALFTATKKKYGLMEYKKIEIKKKADGSIRAHVHALAQSSVDVAVSVSHENNMAVAMAVVIKK